MDISPSPEGVYYYQSTLIIRDKVKYEGLGHIHTVSCTRHEGQHRYLSSTQDTTHMLLIGIRTGGLALSFIHSFFTNTGQFK